MVRRRSISIVVLMLLCYSYVLPRWADWSQTSRLALVRALVEQQTVRIDAFVTSTGDYAIFNGHAYSDKAPGPALLAAPIYALLRPIMHTPPALRLQERIARSAAFAATLNRDGAGLGAERVALALNQYLITLLVIALPAAISVAALDWLLRRWFQPAPALLGALAYGLATPFATYASNLYSHALVAALLIGGWALIERAADQHRRFGLLAVAGLLLGWATISEYPAALIAGVLGLAAMARLGWRAALPIVLGALPAFGVLIAYDLAAFGTPWPVGYAYSALWQQQHQTGFISLTYPHPAALWGLLGSGYRGLFARAPWLLLALPGAILWWRSRRNRMPLIVASAAALSLWLVYGSSQMWWGGFAAGPRYLVPILPFLAVLATWVINRVWRSVAGRWIVLGLAALSVALVWAEALAGQQFPPDTILEPWFGWTIPAWTRGDIARNLGMALGLRGIWSLLPLVVTAGIGGLLIVRSNAIRPSIRRLAPALRGMQ